MSARPGRWLVSRLCALAAVGTLAAGCGGPSGADLVVLVTLDTTRADRLGCYGHADAETPVLDALADEGVLFLQASTPVTCTLPAHSSVMTGLYPTATGIRYNTIFQLGDNHVTLAERFADAGYRTAAFVSAYPLASAFGLAQGFEIYDSPDVWARAEARDEPTERRAADSIDRVIGWIEAQGEAKAFVWLHLWDPHWPYDPPFPYNDRFRHSPYDGEIAYTDRELGRLFDFLRSRGRWEDSIIVVAGDHGEGLRDHREQYHSLLVYETTVRVPLIVKVPGSDRGIRVDTPVSLVDIAPTLVELCGLAEVEAPVPAQGISLVPALGGDDLEFRELYSEALAGSLLYGWSPVETIRSGAWKYIEGGDVELYDLESDPGETRNLASVERELADELAAALAELRIAITPSDEAVYGETPDLDPETLARMASLGYVGGAGGATVSSDGPAPRDLVFLEPDLIGLQMLSMQRDWSRAESRAEYVIERDPGNRFALYIRALALANLSRWDEALRVARELVAVHTDSADYYDLVGQILIGLGRSDEAARLFEETRERLSDSEALAFHHALAEFEAGREARACEEIVPSALRRVDRRQRLLLLEARCHLRDGDRDAATASLQAVVDGGYYDAARLGELEEFKEILDDVRFPETHSPGP